MKGLEPVMESTFGVGIADLVGSSIHRFQEPQTRGTTA